MRAAAGSGEKDMKKGVRMRCHMMADRKKLCCVLLAAAAAFTAAGDGNKEGGGAKFTRGAVCLTFDDGHFDKWVKVIPLFKQYDAHATFFATGDVNVNVIGSAKKLLAEGHSVGTHGLRHRDAPQTLKQVGAEKYLEEEIRPQLAAFTRAGIAVTCHAYANNRRDVESDDALRRLAGLRRFRAGCLPEDKGKPPAERDSVFFPAAEAGSHPVMRGFGIGEYYHTNIEEVLAAVRRAAERNEVLTIFSHSIQPGAKGVHMPTETLEVILRECQRLGVKAVGFDEL